MMKAFIFDMDGVIIDSEPLHFEVDLLTLAYFGAQGTKEDLERFVGMTNPEMWAVLRDELQLAPTVAEIIEYQLANKIERLTQDPHEPIDGIKELLEQLKQRQIPIAIASSSPRVFIEAVLKKFEIIDLFSCIVSGEEVPKGKPAPDVYLEAASQLGVRPQDCVVLEDSRNGIIAAKAAGMRCIGYVNLNSGIQDLSQADLIVSSVRDINLEDGVLS